MEGRDFPEKGVGGEKAIAAKRRESTTRRMMNVEGFMEIFDEIVFICHKIRVLRFFSGEDG